MSQDEIDLEGHRKVLEESTDGAGGCTEMWESLSEIREGNNSSTRRSILKKAAGVGIGAMSFTQMMESARATGQAVDVSEPGRGEKQRVVSEALKDSRVKRIRKRLLDMGYHPQVNDAKVVNAEVLDSELEQMEEQQRGKVPERVKAEGEWDAVVIPFGPTDDNERVYISWTSASNVDDQVWGTRWERIEPDDGEAYWNVENYTVDTDGNLTVKEDEIANFLGCDDPDVGCIAVIAATWGAMLVACFTCGASAGWLIPACAYCLLGVAGTFGSITTCDWCKSDDIEL